MLEVERGSRAAASKGVDDLCFHTYGKFSPSAPSGNWDLGHRAGFRLRGWYLGLKAEIWVSRLEFKPRG